MIKQIIDESTISRMLKRIAHEILEKNKGTDNLVIIGIMKKGTYIAKRIHENIKQIEGVDLPLGKLDITSYRDDALKKEINNSQINFAIEDKIVILVDDVLYTGRTVRAALDALVDYGRPRLIQLATLIDRGHRELPIRSDFVGKNIPTSRKETVIVTLKEKDGTDGVFIKKNQLD